MLCNKDDDVQQIGANRVRSIRAIGLHHTGSETEERLPVSSTNTQYAGQVLQ